MKKSPVRQLAKMVRELTGGGKALIEWLVEVQEGRVDAASMKDRLDAAKILLERGFGKAPLTIEVTGQVNHVHLGGKVDLGKLSDDDLASMRATLRKALPAAGEDVLDVEPEPE